MVREEVTRRLRILPDVALLDRRITAVRRVVQTGGQVGRSQNSPSCHKLIEIPISLKLCSVGVFGVLDVLSAVFFRF